MFHGEAVTGECVCRIELQDFGEGGDLVHGLMVLCLGRVGKCVAEWIRVDECSKAVGDLDL
jgi:hypothetical protein